MRKEGNHKSNPYKTVGFAILTASARLKSASRSSKLCNMKSAQSALFGCCGTCGSEARLEKRSRLGCYRRFGYREDRHNEFEAGQEPNVNKRKGSKRTFAATKGNSEGENRGRMPPLCTLILGSEMARAHERNLQRTDFYRVRFSHLKGL